MVFYDNETVWNNGKNFKSRIKLNQNIYVFLYIVFPSFIYLFVYFSFLSYNNDVATAYENFFSSNIFN